VGGQLELGGILITSSDGITWSIVPGTKNYGGQGSGYIGGIWTGRRWIVLRRNASKNYATEVLSSTDGINWSPLSVGRVMIPVAITGTESMLVGCGPGNGTLNVIEYSSDGGRTWTPSQSAESFFGDSGYLDSVEFNGSMYVACGAVQGSGATLRIIYSTNAKDWSRANHPPLGGRGSSLASNGTEWICSLGYDGLLYSPDGINWRKTNFVIPQTLRAGQTNLIYSAPNGMKWSKSLKMWFASTMNSIISSTNGMDWTTAFTNIGQGIV
jgi:hypothetical protein